MPEPAESDIDDDVPPWHEYLEQLRADLEAARGEIERLKLDATEALVADTTEIPAAIDAMLLAYMQPAQVPALRAYIRAEIRVRQQSRATEAELRARVESRDAVVEAARTLRDAKEAIKRRGWAAHLQEADAYQAFFKALAALDAQEPRT